MVNINIEGQKNIKVLVADDDPAAAELITMILDGLGIQRVIIATNGIEALKSFDEPQTSIDLIISDWNMPGMSGDQLLAEVRARNPSLPFILITGRGKIDSTFAKNINDVTAYIEKPYDITKLEDTIIEILGPILE